MSASKEPKKEQQEKDINKINTKDKNGINDPILKDTFKRQVFFFLKLPREFAVLRSKGRVSQFMAIKTETYFKKNSSLTSVEA